MRRTQIIKIKFQLFGFSQSKPKKTERAGNSMNKTTDKSKDISENFTRSFILKKKTPYRIGLIGCGQEGQRHLEEIIRIPEFNLVAAGDVREEALKNVAKTYSVPHVYTNYEEMFAREHLDAVAVVTSADSHFPIIKCALQRGLHVICEKPLTVEPRESNLLVSLAQKKGLLLAVTFTYRFVPDTRKIKELITRRKIGRLMGLHFILLHGTYQHTFSGDNLRKYEHVFTKVKGMVFDCGSHAFDLLSWYADSPVKRVIARAQCNTGYPYPDGCTAILEYQNGVKGLYDYDKLPYYVTSFDENSPWRNFFRIIATGTHGTVLWDFAGKAGNPRQSILKVFTQKGSKEVIFPIYSKERSMQYQQFALSIKSGELTGYFPSPSEAAYTTKVADWVVKDGMKNMLPGLYQIQKKRGASAANNQRK
ncbi:MAG: Gfo/Idh/MocA family oxidoreductase [Verrucomicrobiae bacterium]|nr:Gfo/Idh/MocA family oxidoreductase [Verrucomicrobiae bacterium]